MTLFCKFLLRASVLNTFKVSETETSDEKVILTILTILTLTPWAYGAKINILPS